MGKLKVRITKSTKDTYWYSGSVGEVFEVLNQPKCYMEGEEDYDVVGDSGHSGVTLHIRVCDCEVV